MFDLAKTTSKWVMVRLKVKPFTIGHTDFECDKDYRALILTNEKRREVLVFGEIFTGESFDNLFKVIKTITIEEIKLLI
jgi:hypothetical protein